MATKWDLEFVRCKVPQCIPRELIDAVKHRTFTADEFYAYQLRNLDGPFNHLFALIDHAKKIHGFLWAEQNSLDRSLFVNTFSMGKEHWGKGQAIPHVIEFLRSLSQKVQAPRTYWATTNEKFFTKHGFKRSKWCLMEYVGQIDYTKPEEARGANGPESRIRETWDVDGRSAIAA